MSTAEYAQNQGLTTEQIAAAGGGTEPEQAQPGTRAESVMPPPVVPDQGETPPPPPDDLAPPSDQPFDEQPFGEQPSGGRPSGGQDQAPGAGWTGQQQAQGTGVTGQQQAQGTGVTGQQPGPGSAAAAGPGAADPGLAARDPGPATEDPGLAQGSAGQPGGAGPAGGEQDGQHARLLAEDEMNSIVSRWKSIQADFVDEPRKAVEEADALVAELMQRLASVFAAERANLEQRWSGGDGVSTEDLRVSLRRYRSFFERLLAA